jgi:hypothetical protein
MARIREFDIDIALKVAMKLFWRKGYHTTSLDDLCEAMQISRSSFSDGTGDFPHAAADQQKCSFTFPRCSLVKPGNYLFMLRFKR